MSHFTLDAGTGVTLDCANPECDTKIWLVLPRDEEISSIDLEGVLHEAAEHDDDWLKGYCPCCKEEVLEDDYENDKADAERKEAA